MKEINDKLMKREAVRQSDGTHTKACKSLNEEVSRLTTEVKRGIWQRKVWRVLKSLTNNKPNNSYIITDYGRACVSQCQKANDILNMHMSVSTLKLTKEYRGVMRIHNRALWTL